jgi:hypothetical protein
MTSINPTIQDSLANLIKGASLDTFQIIFSNSGECDENNNLRFTTLITGSRKYTFDTFVAQGDTLENAIKNFKAKLGTPQEHAAKLREKAQNLQMEADKITTLT